MSMESYSKIVNVMTSRTGVPVLGIGHFGNTLKVRISLKISLLLGTLGILEKVMVSWTRVHVLKFGWG